PALRLEPFDACRGERARSEIALDGGPGDERHAVARLHRRLHRLLQAELEPRVEIAKPTTDPAQLVLDDLTHAGTLLHDDQPLAPELVEGHRAACERVAGRADQDHLVLKERLEDDAAMAPRRADDAELELALGDELDDALRVEDGQHDMHLGVALLKLAEQQRED